VAWSADVAAHAADSPAHRLLLHVIEMIRFRVPVWVLSAIVLLSPASCAIKPVPAPPTVRAAAGDVVLYDGLPLPPFRTIRRVRTVTCARQLGRDPDLAATRSALRIEAARAGGNAVGNIMCHHGSGPAHSPCWKIAECTGEVECASSATNHRVQATCHATARR
jgi:hypothetical protein